MKKSNYVGHKLINLKDKIAPPLAAQEKVELEATQVIQRTLRFKDENRESAISEVPPLSNSAVIADIKVASAEIPPAPPVQISEKEDKHAKFLQKALRERKEDYARTKDVVIKGLDTTINDININIKQLEDKIEQLNGYSTKLNKLFNEIKAIDELKWDGYDFSLELSNAGKLVEHARLENMLFRDKLALEDKSITANFNPAQLSPSDFYSSGFAQLFGFGFKLFMPLIIGILISSIVIAASIFIAMGVF